MIMHADEISALLNDSEVNLLADLFLDCYGSDIGSTAYRRLRNAILLVPYSTNGLADVCDMLSLIENVPADALEIGLCEYVRTLDPAPDVTFNNRYSRDSKRGLRMPSDLAPTDVILFLGTAFMYLLNTNYSLTFF